jgi:hypothetical protein
MVRFNHSSNSFRLVVPVSSTFRHETAGTKGMYYLGI